METDYPRLQEFHGGEETSEVSSVHAEDLDNTEETISQFQACVAEIMYRPPFVDPMDT